MRLEPLHQHDAVKVDKSVPVSRYPKKMSLSQCSGCLSCLIGALKIYTASVKARGWLQATLKAQKRRRCSCLDLESPCFHGRRALAPPLAHTLVDTEMQTLTLTRLV